MHAKVCHLVNEMSIRVYQSDPDDLLLQLLLILTFLLMFFSSLYSFLIQKNIRMQNVLTGKKSRNLFKDRINFFISIKMSDYTTSEPKNDTHRARFHKTNK